MVDVLALLAIVLVGSMAATIGALEARLVLHRRKHEHALKEIARLEREIKAMDEPPRRFVKDRGYVSDYYPGVLAGTPTVTSAAPPRSSSVPSSQRPVPNGRPGQHDTATGYPWDEKPKRKKRRG